MASDKLVFIICCPRSGSTLLSRMLGVHSKLYSPPESHLLPPLYHLGYYGTVQRVAEPGQFFHLAQIADIAIRDNVEQLPNKEQDYLAALRRYTDHLYQKLKEKSGKPIFVDKTPTQWRYIPFITSLYPDASYLILSRNPCDVLLSWRKLGLDAFDVKRFDVGETVPGGKSSALMPRSVLRYFWSKGTVAHIKSAMTRVIPAMAELARNTKLDINLVNYEKLVASPATELGRLCQWLGVEYEPGMLDTERYEQLYWKGLGDPTIGPRAEKRKREKSRRQVKIDNRYKESMLRALQPADLEVLGYSRDALLQEVTGRPPTPAARGAGAEVSGNDAGA